MRMEDSGGTGGGDQAEGPTHPGRGGVAALNGFLRVRADQKKGSVRIVGDLGCDEVAAFAGLTDHVEGDVEREAGFDEAAAVVGVGDDAIRAFAVVERMTARDGFVEERDGFDRGFVGADENRAGVVLQVEGLRIAAAGDGSPTAFVAGAGLWATVFIGGGFSDRVGPVLLDVVAKLNARRVAEEAVERGGGFGGALQFDESDEHTVGFGRGKVVQETQSAAKAEAQPEQKAGRETAEPDREGSELVHERRYTTESMRNSRESESLRWLEPAELVMKDTNRGG